MYSVYIHAVRLRSARTKKGLFDKLGPKRSRDEYKCSIGILGTTGKNGRDNRVPVLSVMREKKRRPTSMPTVQ